MDATSPPKRTVFIIEDDPSTLRTLKLILRVEGYSVETASNGAEALQQLHALPAMPSIILLDWMMPEMDGRKFMQHQRSDPKLARIPVLVMSASPEALPGGDSGIKVLRKPIELKKLLKAISAHCRE